MCDESPESPGAEKIEGCWTEEQEKLLSHERFISEICKLRQKSMDQNEPKPRWLQFLESSGGTAIIAALLGGALVQGISASIHPSTLLFLLKCKTGILEQRTVQEMFKKSTGLGVTSSYCRRRDCERRVQSLARAGIQR